ncbi:glycerol-3-phosphate dehydrogenase [Nesterenkonia xinjiangensis]|uniref:Glycerol-3-phosphate dehydrogenase n=2 Tax=Nesterenkonia xinjiangensis TaxID=225327 RepID=A0A7Z0KA63_9MICC|nr:glycerol-3-phosphate dehydrogenase [Nesterenkonia xinjiangensis]
MRAEPLSAETRREALDAMAGTSPEDPLDILIVGGGVVGAAAAFDAATRGLRVGLVESQDLAQGTSSRSSKLVHGGLRYLQMLDFKLVAEALRERDLLLKHTAPHLVRALPFVFPFEKRVVDRAFIGSGVSLYDAMSMRPGEKRPVPFHRHLSRTRLRQRFAGLDHEKFIGALEYYDAQVDDARLVMTLARSAHSLGAQIATRTEVIEYLRAEAPDVDDADQAAAEDAPVQGVTVRDKETGRRLEIHARETILAAGVWTGRQQEAADVPSGLKVLASKGIHITVPKDRIAADDHVGVITQTEKSVLFIIPMGNYWSIGTTDTAWHEDVDTPAPTSEDIDYVLEHANAVLEADLSREDVIGSWAGLRPLLQPMETDESKSSKVSREHTVMQLSPGLSAVAGGKLTTYRVMAEDIISFALGDRQVHRESLTHAMPLLGAQGYSEWESRAPEIARDYGWSDETVDRLLNRYGALLAELLALVDQDADLGEEVPDSGGHLRVEFVYAARAEGALHVEDLLERRTRVFHEVPDRGLRAMETVVELVAPILAWDEETVAREKAAFTGVVEAHLAAERSSSDAEAAGLVSAATPEYLPG